MTGPRTGPRTGRSPRRSHPPTRRVAVVAAVLLVLGLAAGCMQMPASGPVVETDTASGSGDGRATAIDPVPPQPGASAIQVAQGFLEAMTATPIRSSVAQQYLAEDARTSWDPDASTIIYTDSMAPVSVPGGAAIALTSAERLDDRGAWVGDLGPRASTLRLRMVMEDGEFRIADPPDALVVPASWFEQRFRSVSLYFFDRTGQVLVPESVFVPRGEQLASNLVNGLLAGPAGAARLATRSFLPDGLGLGLSVPIDDDGVADVELTGDAPVRSADANALMLAQLAWTMRQDSSIAAIRVSIGGVPVPLPGGVSAYSVEGGAPYDPTGYQSSDLLYGLDRAGLLVSGSPGDLERVSGPLGQDAFGVRSVAVDLAGATAAAVGGDGTSVLQAPVREGEDQGQVQEVVSGATDLLTPSWDVAGRLWLVDRTADGARVLHVDEVGSGQPREVRVPGVTGRDVVDVLVSRDATRLVAVVRGARSDRLQTARILVTDQGRVRGAVADTRIVSEDGGRLRVRDLAWTSPTTASLLSTVRDDLVEVRTITVDGAPSGLSTLSTTVRGPVRGLAGSPVVDQPTYAVGRSRLVDVSSGGEVAVTGVVLRSLGYAG